MRKFLTLSFPTRRSSDLEARAGAAAQCLHEVAQLLVLPQLVGRGAGDVQDLAAQRQHRLGGTVARLLGGAAGAVALAQEDLGVLGAGARAVGELAEIGRATWRERGCREV